MQEDHHRLGSNNVMMDGNYFQPVRAQRLQGGSDFVLEHCDISRYHSILVCSVERRPAVETHACIDDCAHFFEPDIVTSHCDLVDHAVLFAVVADDLRNPSSVEAYLRGSAGSCSRLCG